jgi:glycosyltransferase involved in cell wall biosynthesis
VHASSEEQTVGPADSRRPFLSIVIPAYNEARRLPGSLEQIRRHLSGRPYVAEVLVVDNGSTDGTLAVARRAAADFPAVRALREDRRGKGLAVRAGMLQARGEYRFLCDADLSMPIEEVDRFLPPQREGFDVAIGSREAPGANVIGEPLRRRRIGRMFNRLVRALLLPGLRDTQCGFKCFTAEAAEDLFARQQLMGMAFDTEVLYVARRRGYRIVEVPITWRFDPDSRVRMVRDSWQMACDLLRVRRNGRKGLYDGRP